MSDIIATDPRHIAAQLRREQHEEDPAGVADIIVHRPLRIVSGEGTGQGGIETYHGARTLRALRSRLTRERCRGDRWAYLEFLQNGCWTRLDI